MITACLLPCPPHPCLPTPLYLYPLTATCLALPLAVPAAARHSLNPASSSNPSHTLTSVTITGSVDYVLAPTPCSQQRCRLMPVAVTLRRGSFVVVASPPATPAATYFALPPCLGRPAPPLPSALYGNQPAQRPTLPYCRAFALVGWIPLWRRVGGLYALAPTTAFGYRLYVVPGCSVAAVLLMVWTGRFCNAFAAPQQRLASLRLVTS